MSQTTSELLSQIPVPRRNFKITYLVYLVNTFVKFMMSTAIRCFGKICYGEENVFCSIIFLFLYFVGDLSLLVSHIHGNNEYFWDRS